MAAQKDVLSDKYRHWDFDDQGYVVDLDNLHPITDEPSLSERASLSSLSLKDIPTVSYPIERNAATKQKQQEIESPCTYEIAIEEGGEEADLKNGYQNCGKKAHHKNYIAIQDFTIHRLPETFQDIDVVKMIQAISDITAKLDIRCVSKERPEYWPQSEQQKLKEEKLKPFPLYAKRGTKICSVGTGRISRVEKCNPEDPQKTCTCKKCRASDTPSKVWWTVSLYTAVHVVFDEHEAAKTTCTLFYDSPQSEKVTFDDWKIERSEAEVDMCIMETTSCDEKLMTRLENMVQEWRAQWNMLLKKYKGTELADKLVVIVSHPHGCPKQISFGFLKDKRVEIQVMDTVTCTTYRYETTTCPGSSGAHVHLIGRYDDAMFVDHVHNGVDTNGNNFCSPGMEYLFDD